jgi:hypothetical protein
VSAVGVRGPREAGDETTEVAMVGQLALSIEQESVVPAAVWETLPLQTQTAVTVMLARLLAAAIEGARDE